MLLPESMWGPDLYLGLVNWHRSRFMQWYAKVSDAHVQVVSMQKVQPEGEEDDSSFAAQAPAPQVQPRLTSAAMHTYAQASQAQPVAGSQQGGMNSMRVCAWQTLLTACLADLGMGLQSVPCGWGCCAVLPWL